MASRFRKAFIVCENNKIFGCMTNIVLYKSREDAEGACKRAQLRANAEQEKMWKANQPVPKFKVHAFFLVHEDVFRD